MPYHYFLLEMSNFFITHVKILTIKMQINQMGISFVLLIMIFELLNFILFTKMLCHAVSACCDARILPVILVWFIAVCICVPSARNTPKWNFGCLAILLCQWLSSTHHSCRKWVIRKYLRLTPGRINILNWRLQAS